MAQSVVYADLRFTKVPAGRSTPCQALEAALCEDEAESPYENVQPGQVPVGQDGQGARPSPGPWRRLWSVPAGLLAACLLLLAVAVALGLCYLQVTRRLQDASRAHAAERGRLSQQVSVQEQSLEQAQLELARARAELQRAWLEGNSSRLELGHRDAELEHVTGTLRRTETELQDVKGKLNASEITVSSLRACVNTDCCPPGWVLYRGKCLFISAEKKSWWDSKEYCESKSSLLLVQGRWESWTLPVWREGGCGHPGGWWRLLGPRRALGGERQQQAWGRARAALGGRGTAGLRDGAGVAPLPAAPSPILARGRAGAGLSPGAPGPPGGCGAMG
ncbi:B-cell differentiation antigen CD72-like isoform X4 [Struthio camelus]|uniref:B-cell differentiation antigen CD72-like isoform X4 n=1 Tax=Struthio camelus TaxID=8801 RepID=UPI003603FBB0